MDVFYTKKQHVKKNIMSLLLLYVVIIFNYILVFEFKSFDTFIYLEFLLKFFISIHEKFKCCFAYAKIENLISLLELF